MNMPQSITEEKGDWWSCHNVWNRHGRYAGILGIVTAVGFIEAFVRTSKPVSLRWACHYAFFHLPYSFLSKAAPLEAMCTKYGLSIKQIHALQINTIQDARRWILIDRLQAARSIIAIYGTFWHFTNLEKNVVSPFIDNHTVMKRDSTKISNPQQMAEWTWPVEGQHEVRTLSSFVVFDLFVF